MKDKKVGVVSEESEVKVIEKVEKVEFTLEEYEIIFKAVGGIQISLNDPLLAKLVKIQDKIKKMATDTQNAQKVQNHVK